jgi:hypothetical protein
LCCWLWYRCCWRWSWRSGVLRRRLGLCPGIYAFLGHALYENRSGKQIGEYREGVVDRETEKGIEEEGKRREVVVDMKERRKKEDGQ